MNLHPVGPSASSAWGVGGGQQVGRTVTGGSFTTAGGMVQSMHGVPSTYIDDILEIVGDWGPCPAQPAECNGDVFPFPSGNGVVDIDDLLEVIGNWPIG